MLKVLKSGFFTSIQDNGRYGYRNKGVPISGAMDTKALDKANLLLENLSNAPVLEITMTGPTLLFEDSTFICLTGAELSATLNNKPIENYKVYGVQKGDILSYGKLELGFRGYLAVKGGFKTEMVLDSASQYLPLTSAKCIAELEELAFAEVADFEPKITALKIDSYLHEKELKVKKGPEYGMLSDEQLNLLFSKKFTVAKENNRMAYQLNEHLPGHDNNILTSATLAGTVQLTPAGKLIVLMKDGQTTGGYPRILQLNEDAICALAQKRAGDDISFKLT